MQIAQRPSGRLLLLGCACALAFLLGEILVRATGAAPQVAFLWNDQFQLSKNVRIGWEPIPNHDSTGDSLNPGWNEAQRNSLGYRDDEHSIAKGFGTDRHEGTFPSVLERKLNEAGARAEVMNFGVEGYNTQQEVETLRDHGLAYSPDLVVLAYVLNDRKWPAHHVYVEMLQQERRTRSALYRFLRFGVLDRFFPRAVSSDARVQELVDLVQKDTVEEHFSVIVVVFSWLDALPDDAHRAEHDWVAALSSRHGFRHLDFLDTFVECARVSRDPVGLDEIHPTLVGLYRAGVKAAGYIQEAGLARAGR